MVPEKKFPNSRVIKWGIGLEHEVRYVKQDSPVSGLNVTELLLLSLMVFAAWTAFEMLRPYLDAILIAALFAVIMNPIYQRLLSLLAGRRSLVAFLTSLLLTAVVVIPCFLVIWRLSQEAGAFSQSVAQWVDSDSFQEFMKKTGSHARHDRDQSLSCRSQGTDGESDRSGYADQSDGSRHRYVRG